VVEFYKLLIEMNPGIDKLYHLYYGCILSIMLFLLFDHKSYLICALPILLGLSKELIDVNYGLGEFEWMDIFWTSFSSVVAFVIIRIKE